MRFQFQNLLNKLIVIFLILVALVSIFGRKAIMADCYNDGPFYNCGGSSCTYSCNSSGSFALEKCTDAPYQDDNICPGQYVHTGTSNNCSSNPEAKAFCGLTFCKNNGICGQFSGNDLTCCQAVNSSCGQCLKISPLCTPDEAYGIDWDCVYNNNCQSGVWNAGCQSIPPPAGPVCQSTLGVGTYFPGQSANVSGQATSNPNVNPLQPLVSFGLTLSSPTQTVVNADWYAPAVTTCSSLTTSGISIAGTAVSGGSTTTYQFNGPNGNMLKSFSGTASRGSVGGGACDLDPKTPCVGASCYTNSCMNGSSSGGYTDPTCVLSATLPPTFKPTSITDEFDWLVSNLDNTNESTSVTATWTAQDLNARNCTNTGIITVANQICIFPHVAPTPIKETSSNPQPVSKVIVQATNPNSHFNLTSKTAVCNSTTTGFPQNYAIGNPSLNTGNSTITTFSYLDDSNTGTNFRFQPGVTTSPKVLAYTGTWSTIVPPNGNPNSDGSVHRSALAGNTVTVLFVGTNITIRGTLIANSVGGGRGLVTIDGSPAADCLTTSPDNLYHYYQPVCSYSVSIPSSTNIHKLVLTSNGTHTLDIDAFEIANANVVPWTPPAFGANPQNCNFSATVTNKYGYTSVVNVGDACNNFPATFCQSTVPATPTGLTPIGTVTLSGAQTTLGWTHTDFGTSCAAQNNTYTVYMDTSPNPSTVVCGGLNSSIKTCTVNVVGGQTYYYRVRADNGSLFAEASASFNTANLPYFQVVGGPATAIGQLKSLLPISTFLSASSSGHLDSGIISGSSLNLGSGAFSQVSTPPGASRTAVTNPYPNIAKLSYNNLYTTVLTNAGVNPTANLTANCNGALGYFDSGFYRFSCYQDGTAIGTFLTGANVSSSQTNVLIPFPGSATANNPVIPNLSISGKKVIIFANGTVRLPASISVAATNTSGLVAIVNGDLDAATNNTGQMDGLYIFSGTLNSGGGPSQLLGNGSLIGTGTTPFNFTRTYGTTGATNPAEKWTYQGKYLWLFRGIISAPTYTWREQAPQ